MVINYCYGKITSKVVPEFALFLTKMLPLCTLTISRTSARPSPTPPSSRLLDLSRRKKGSNIPTMKSQGAAKNEANNAAQETKSVEKIDFSKVKVEPLFEEMVDFDTFSKSDFRAVKVKACEAVKKSKKLLQFTLDDGTGTDRTILSGIHAYYEPEELVGKTLIAITNLPPRAMMGIDSCGMLLSAIHEEEGEEKLHLLMVDDHIPAGAKVY